MEQVWNTSLSPQVILISSINLFRAVSLEHTVINLQADGKASIATFKSKRFVLHAVLLGLYLGLRSSEQIAVRRESSTKAGQNVHFYHLKTFF